MNMKTTLSKLMMMAVLMMTLGSINAQSKYKPENPGWLVNLDVAYEQSKATNKPILANFTGSDWCGWCKRLTASVFKHDEFKNWADKNVVLLELDFPKRKKLPSAIAEQNRGLQQAFQVRGYPSVWLFDIDKDPKDGMYSIDALGKTGYNKTVSDFTDAVDKMIARRGE